MDIGAISGGLNYSSINYQSSQTDDTEELLVSELQGIDLNQSETQRPSFNTAINKAMESQSTSQAEIVPPPLAYESSKDLFEEYDINEMGVLAENPLNSSGTELFESTSEQVSPVEMFDELMPQDIQDMFFQTNQQKPASDEDTTNSETYSSIINQQFATQVNEYLKQAGSSDALGQNISDII